MGLCLRRLRLQYPRAGVAGFNRNQWQLSIGISGNLRLESVAGFDRNQWQPSRGTRILEFTEHGVGADPEHPRYIANPTGVETHVNDRLLYLRQAPAVAVVEEKLPVVHAVFWHK